MASKQERAADFGALIQDVRKSAYKESLRTFGARIEISPSYLNKLERGIVGPPSRETIQAIADKLKLTSEPFLTRAGYIPDTSTGAGAADSISILLEQLTPEQLAAVVAFINLVRDADIIRRTPSPRDVLGEGVVGRDEALAKQ